MNGTRLKGYLSMAEFADKCGVTRGYIHQLIMQNYIEAYYVGKTYVIPESEVSKMRKGK